MRDIKQILCVRRDLKMRKGKIAAQCAHASLKVFLDRGQLTEYRGRGELQIELGHAEIEWIKGVFTKVCVGVDSEEELLKVHQAALDADIPCSLITDLGLTEFKGVPTKTVVAIGPDYSDRIDPITKDLKLL